MIRKAYIIGTLALGMAIAASGVPARVASSVHSFQHNFQQLESSNSLNPVERFVFSLVLADTGEPQQKKPVPAPRS